MHVCLSPAAMKSELNLSVWLALFSWSMLFVDEPNSGVVVLVEFLNFLQTDSTERPKKKKYEILYKDGVSQQAQQTIHLVTHAISSYALTYLPVMFTNIWSQSLQVDEHRCVLCMKSLMASRVSHILSSHPSDCSDLIMMYLCSTASVLFWAMKRAWLF